MPLFSVVSPQNVAIKATRHLIKRSWDHSVCDRNAAKRFQFLSLYDLWPRTLTSLLFPGTHPPHLTIFSLFELCNVGQPSQQQLSSSVWVMLTHVPANIGYCEKKNKDTHGVPCTPFSPIPFLSLFSLLFPFFLLHSLHLHSLSLPSLSFLLLPSPLSYPCLLLPLLSFISAPLRFP